MAAYADRVSKLIRDPAMRQTCGKSLQARAQQQFSFAQMAGQLEGIWQMLRPSGGASGGQSGAAISGPSGAASGGQRSAMGGVPSGAASGGPRSAMPDMRIPDATPMPQQEAMDDDDDLLVQVA